MTKRSKKIFIRDCSIAEAIIKGDTYTNQAKKHSLSIQRIRSIIAEKSRSYRMYTPDTGLKWCLFHRNHLPEFRRKPLLASFKAFTRQRLNNWDGQP